MGFVKKNFAAHISVKVERFTSKQDQNYQRFILRFPSDR